MKRKNWKRTVAFLAAGSLLSAGALSAWAKLELGGLGTTQNQIAAWETETQGDLVALDDLGISVKVSDYTSICQEDGFVYVYMMEEDFIPYVIIGYYDTDAADFADQFTRYMSEGYADLQVTEAAGTVNLGGRDFTRIGYSYTVSGYAVRDTRLFFTENRRTYMFGAKEIPELSCYVGSALEEAAGSFAYLAGGDSDYEKHVDSGRSVTGKARSAVEDVEQAVGDVIGQEDSGTGNASAGTVGTVGGTSKSAGNTGDVSGSTTETGSIVFDETAADYAGTWVPFQDGFQLYLPSDWNVYEVTEEQSQQGVLYLAGDASGAEYAPAVSVVWAYSDGAETLEDLAAAIRQGGYQVDDLVTINGIGCVAYRLEEEDCSAVMFFHPTDRQYVFCVTGTQYAENVDTICTALTSLSPYSS